MNYFKFQTVFTNDITEKCVKFHNFLRFWHFLDKFGYQSTSNRLRASKNINGIS